MRKLKSWQKFGSRGGTRDEKKGRRRGRPDGRGATEDERERYKESKLFLMKPCDTMQKLGSTQLSLGTNQLSMNESVQMKAVSEALPLSTPSEGQRKRASVWDIKAESEKRSENQSRQNTDTSDYRTAKVVSPCFLTLHHRLHCNRPWADACHIPPTQHRGPEHTHRSDITPISLWSHFRLLYLGLMWWEDEKRSEKKMCFGRRHRL